MSAVDAPALASGVPVGLLPPRELLTRFLTGSGIEIGPGHTPFPLPFGGASTRYVDRWQPDDNRSLFPELGEAAAGFIQPDVVANLDTDRLSALADGIEDYVIASHVLEHLADPLGQLAEIHRVLRPGGVALILLPDRRQTFDRDRDPTPLEHLVEDHRRGVTTVGDDHIEDFLRKTNTWDGRGDEAERRGVFELHRQRSIHVHTWSQDEFPPVLEHTILEMGMRWELLDAIFVEDVPGAIEFGMVLRRSDGDAPAGELAGRLLEAWRALAGRAGAAGQTAAAYLDLQARHAVAEGRLSRLTSLPGYRIARRLHRLGRRVRGRWNAGA
jgi:SAM-dependent methyltransferase